MTTNIIETLPWIDYKEVFEQLEERGRAEGRAEGKAEGRAERDMEIALAFMANQKRGTPLPVLKETLTELGISPEIIDKVVTQFEASRNRQSKNRAERER